MMKSLVIGICGLVILATASGCASVANGYYHTQHDMDNAPQTAGFTVKAYDPEIGGPSISADVGQILSNLWDNHTPSTLIAGVLDIATGYFIGKQAGWWGKSGSSGSLSQAELDAQNAQPTSNYTGGDSIVIRGNNNTVDTSSGRNSSDSHNNPDPVIP